MLRDGVYADIVTNVRSRFWRVLAPRWAHQPLSGEGAARHGGRWNPRGVAALYMSADLSTAVAEYEQELGIRPGTFVAYDVDVEGVVDLPHRRRTGPRKWILLRDRTTPPGWTIAEATDWNRGGGNSGAVGSYAERHELSFGDGTTPPIARSSPWIPRRTCRAIRRHGLPPPVRGPPPTHPHTSPAVPAVAPARPFH